MRSKRRRIELVCSCLLICSTLLLSQFMDDKGKTSSSNQVQFSRCTDGDTAHFIIDGVDTTVRLLAIDTPETKHPQKGVEPFGVEASDFTCNAISTANTIRLEYEDSDRIDKYNRSLAWIFLDEQLLQSMLIEKGLAQVDYLYGDYKYTDQLIQNEVIAKKMVLDYSVTLLNDHTYPRGRKLCQ